MNEDVTRHPVAYCRYVCTACPGGADGCPGCKQGGGDEGCHQRVCCSAKGLSGCWECTDFPCDQGPYASDEWRGLSIGMAQAARDLGVDIFLARVRAIMGERMDFALYRHQSPEDIRALLDGPSGG